MRILKGHTAEVTGLLYPATDRVLSAGWDSPARLWDVSGVRGGLVGAFEHADWVRGLAWSPVHGLAAAPCKDGTLYLWPLAENVPTRTPIVVPVGEKSVDAAAFSPDGALLAAGARDGVLRIWRVDALLAGEFAPLWAADAHSKPVLALTFSPDGRFIATGGGDNRVHLWALRPA